MNNKQKTVKKRFYCSMVEFDQDFFPRSFGEKQVKKPTDNQAIGVNLVKESFRQIRQEMTQDEISALA